MFSIEDDSSNPATQARKTGGQFENLAENSDKGFKDFIFS